MTFLFRTPFLSFVLIPLLIGEPVWAQTPVSPTSDETAGGSNLQLRIVSADNSRISAGGRSAKGYTIQVINENGAGVPEVAVAFRLPDSGSSGVFADGSHSAVAYTDNGGNAHVDGIQWNAIPGVAVVRITASKGNDHAGLLVEQTLLSPGDSSATAAVMEPARPMPLPSPVPAPLERPAPPMASVMKPESISISSIGRGDRSLLANPLQAAAEPSISIVSSPQEKFSTGGGSMKKWIILGIVIAAGAGAGFAFAGRSGKSSSTAGGSSSISFGSPTVSVDHP